MEEIEEGELIEVNNSNWDDSELINTWELAVQEYNKYYSITKKRKRKPVPVPVPVPIHEPDIPDIPETRNDTKLNSNTMMNTNTINNTKMNMNRNMDKSINTDTMDMNKTITMNYDFLIPTSNNIQDKEMIKLQIINYYNGYKAGLHKNPIDNKSLWYLVGYETASNLTPN